MPWIICVYVYLSKVNLIKALNASGIRILIKANISFSRSNKRCGATAN